MILQYGNYVHDNAEVWFEIDVRAVHSPIGRREMYVYRWTITGVKTATTKAELTTKLKALKAAYTLDYQDLTFFDSDGSTLTAHSIRNADTISGVKVRQFRWLPGNPGIWGSGTEYVNKRTFQVVIEADVLDSESSILSWHESIRQIGDGGEAWMMLGALTGPVQKQRLQEFTAYTVLQQGHAVGHGAYPTPASPIWPGSLHRDRTRSGLNTPQFHPIVNTHFPVSWAYVFESANALTGGPTLF